MISGSKMDVTGLYMSSFHARSSGRGMPILGCTYISNGASLRAVARQWPSVFTYFIEVETGEEKGGGVMKIACLPDVN
jgi:hypothetical protein